MNTSGHPSRFKPFEAQPAATLLLLRDDPFRVLTVTRNANSSFPSAIVFPGGMVEPEDYADGWNDYLAGHEQLAPGDRALRIAACRETWEETAVSAPRLPLVALPKPPPTQAFGAHLHKLGARLDLSSVVPFSHWITPPGFERRYDTHMFIARTTEHSTAVCDGVEIVDTQWLEPREALVRAHDGDRAILFSTYFNMSLLAESISADDAIASALQRPIVPIIPRLVHDTQGSWIKIDDGAGYPVTRLVVSRSAATSLENPGKPQMPSAQHGVGELPERA